MKTTSISLARILVLTFTLFSAIPTHGQTREAGEWWPHPEWGAEDQAGASNRITPKKMLEALQLAKTGSLYELGQVYEQNMPLYGNRTYAMILPSKGAAWGENKLVGNDEFLATQIGQVGTQFDGLGHIGKEVTMANGETHYVFYNGYTAREMDAYDGLQKLGIEHVKPIITKGILIDIAKYKGVDRLPNSYEVTVADVRGALQAKGLSENDIAPGDALLFRYGWSTLWEDHTAYNTNPPGIGVEVARWVADRKVTMVGSDSWCTEVIPNPNPNVAFPVHQELMMKHGIYNLENMNLEALSQDGLTEFLFMVHTIRFKGATGSPARPIAIR